MSPSLPPFLSDDLIAEVLSFLDVKSILRFKCVCKFWNTLFSDPTFVKLHLNQSSKRNTHFLLITEHDGSNDETECEVGVIPYSIRTLLDNPSFTISVDSYYLLEDKSCSYTPQFIGSCNGLICLLGISITSEYYESSLRLWNPATRTISPKFGFLRLFKNHSFSSSWYDGHYIFTFGYDNSTDTYKVVASRYNRLEHRSDIRILSMGDNVWEDIQSFPVDPLNFATSSKTSGVYFESSINWLGIQNRLWYDHRNITIEQFVIVSLDLGTETYRLYQPPSGFYQVPPSAPNVGVLGDCLSFSCCYNKTHLIIWQMKKFGVQDSWTQFLKISYHNLQIQIDCEYSYNALMYRSDIVPLFLSEDGDTLLLHSNQEISQNIIYNWRNNAVERTKITARKKITEVRTVNNALCAAEKYFESLVSVF